jgi:hypothetical protein
MFSDPKTTAFEMCLRRLLAGESIEQATVQYPDWAAEFQPMLQAVLAARESGNHPRVPKAALARSRARFLRAARQRQQSKPARLGAPGSAPWHIALAALSMLVLLILSGAVTATLAAQALPGDPLYNLKIFGEQTQLRYTKDPVQRLELQQTFDNKRLEEVDQLIQEERALPVNFVGALVEMGSGTWRVGDINVHLNEQTSLDGELQVGLIVAVDGTLQADGSVVASRIWDRSFVFTGELMRFSTESWYVSGVDILILPQTRIEGLPALGSRLEMLIVQLADERWFARVVNVVWRGANPPTAASLPVIQPSPTLVQPSPTIEVQPQPSYTPQPTHTPQPSATPMPSETPDDDDGLETPRPTPEPEATETPKPSKTPEPEDDDDETPTPTVTSLPSPTQTPTPTPTSTPPPTRTPEPTEEDDEED